MFLCRCLALYRYNQRTAGIFAFYHNISFEISHILWDKWDNDDKEPCVYSILCGRVLNLAQLKRQEKYKI